MASWLRNLSPSIMTARFLSPCRACTLRVWPGSVVKVPLWWKIPQSLASTIMLLLCSRNVYSSSWCIMTCTFINPSTKFPGCWAIIIVQKANFSIVIPCALKWQTLLKCNATYFRNWFVRATLTLIKCFILILNCIHGPVNTWVNSNFVQVVVMQISGVITTQHGNFHYKVTSTMWHQELFADEIRGLWMMPLISAIDLVICRICCNSIYLIRTDFWCVLITGLPLLWALPYITKIDSCICTYCVSNCISGSLSLGVRIGPLKFFHRL